MRQARHQTIRQKRRKHSPKLKKNRKKIVGNLRGKRSIEEKILNKLRKIKFKNNQSVKAFKRKRH